MMKWTSNHRLPASEPNENNRVEYAHPQLLSGASDDGRFIYDAIWAETEAVFVLTVMWINEEFGFVEDTVRLYPKNRAELLQQVAAFQAAPESFFGV
ncbi:hypothetical protein [Wielerella bovis]|uniref:hypothetical protein n=1 Tax=Wielerella bovis TaxID=2917790 RepID=UPI002018C350|nr:hypothetical protein [Wielerella bovis]ULJ61215.1 hypothetical protein MIS44_05050 [Wielerella bovis]